jgi:AcrR family transcriptional regulator
MTSVKRRAVSDAQKAQRREDILNSARELFQNCSRYDAILMKHIAENIKLTKGTLYLYFKTKEEVFLALYEQEFLTLCQRMQSAVLAHAKNRKAGLGAEELQDVFVSAVAGQDTFLRLNGLLHSVLEQNIEFDTALRFKTMLRDRMIETAAVLEANVDGLKAGQGAELLLLVHEVTIGSYHTASPSPCLNLVFERPDMQFMKLHFDEEYPKLLGYMLKGFLSAT